MNRQGIRICLIGFGIAAICNRSTADDQTFGRKVEPGAATATSTIQVMQSHSVAVVASKDARRFFGHGRQGGGWDKWQAPEGVRGTVVISAGVATLELEGEVIDSIVAFSPKTGKWHPFRLIEPASKKLTPVISAGIVACYVNGHAYAFSAAKGTWDVVANSAPPTISADSAMAADDSQIAFFTEETGRWVVLSKAEIEGSESAE